MNRSSRVLGVALDARRSHVDLGVFGFTMNRPSLVFPQ
jgi:hypothetical protein